MVTDGTQGIGGISREEAALYDRQIRLWGLEAQQRIRNAKILIARLNGVNTEVVKNLVLAGVGSVVVADHEIVREQDLGAQFFLTADDVGKTRSEAALERVQELNPRVDVIALPTALADMPDTYYDQFQFVCAAESDMDKMRWLDSLCSRRNLKLWIARTSGFLGLMFCNLGNYSYVDLVLTFIPIREIKDQKSVRKSIRYVSLDDTFRSKFEGSPRQLKRKASPVFFAYLVLFAFEQNTGHSPRTESPEDLNRLLSMKAEVLSNVGVAPVFVPDELLSRLASAASHELSCVCAVLGGIVSQEIIKVISGVDKPVHNILALDALESEGVAMFSGPADAEKVIEENPVVLEESSTDKRRSHAAMDVEVLLDDEDAGVGGSSADLTVQKPNVLSLDDDDVVILD
ncbi:hypothetical protein BJ742DRAFT_673247 [Cladochytrium replicatum]|nr:hypothetical protein BJ742DRAFT_673247 [Cladochytrium replicatum]